MSDESELLQRWRETIAHERQAARENILEMPEDIQLLKSGVSYVFEPSLLPFPYLAFDRWARVLASEYGLEFKPFEDEDPDFLSSDEHISALGDRFFRQANINFDDGLLRVNNQAIPIPRVHFGRESVQCNILGPTFAGDQFVKEVVRLMWVAVDVEKSWDEIREGHQIVSYDSATRVKIPDFMARVFSPALREMLESWERAGGIARRMGIRARLFEWGEPDGLVMNHTFEDLEFLYHKTSKADSESCRVRLSVGARHERGADVVIVQSELPTIEHVELVRELLATPSSPTEIGRP